MSDDRQLMGETRGDAAHLLLAGVRRRAVAVEDVFLPEPLRLGEWLRATVRALLGKYVRAVETELRSALVEDDLVRQQDELHASLSSAHVQIALPLLERSAALRDPELIAVLVRRAEEHRFLRAAAPPADRALLAGLVADPAPSIAAQAMALLVAQSRRFDRFQEPVLARTELPADLQHRLVWTIAAALRVYMVDRHGIAPAAADRALAEAAARLLAAYDEGDTLEARCARLARALRDADRLSDAMIGQSLDDGNLPLFVAMLAARTGLAERSVAEIAAVPAEPGAALLLRAAGVDRDIAATALIRLVAGGAAAGPVREAELEAQLDMFDAHDPVEARERLGLWRIDPAYRTSLAQLLARQTA